MLTITIKAYFKEIKKFNKKEILFASLAGLSGSVFAQYIVVVAIRLKGSQKVKLVDTHGQARGILPLGLIKGFNKILKLYFLLCFTSIGLKYFYYSDKESIRRIGLII
jgi:hypothetical protein